MNEPVKACGVCVRRHAVKSGLECRMLPPVQREGRFAVYPTVRAEDYCHAGFSPDEARAAAPTAPRPTAPQQADLLTRDEEAPPATPGKAARRGRADPPAADGASKA